MTVSPRPKAATLLRFVAPAAAGAGIAVLVRGIDLGHALTAIRNADPLWMLLALVLSGLTASAGALVWGILARATCADLGWGEIASWSGRAVLAGQVVPGGAGGDAVRVLSVGRRAGFGTAVAGDLLARICGAVGITLWGAAGAFLLRDAVGPFVVGAAAFAAGGCLLSLLIVLQADHILGFVEHRHHPLARRVAAFLHPLADALAIYRTRPGMLFQCCLISCAGWGLNLAAFVCLGHAVAVGVGWQVFAVSMPVALVATLAPLSPNGVGMREGILIGLLVKAGAAGPQAAALSILVDIQLLPVAVIGAAVGLRPGRAERRREEDRRDTAAAALLPEPVPA